MKKMLKNKILSKLNKEALDFKNLKTYAGIKNKKELEKCLQSLKEEGLIVKHKNMFYNPKNIGLYRAKIIQICQKFGFAQRLSDEAKIFIPGKFLKGAMIDDLVLIYPIAPNKHISGKSEEGAVKLIYKKNNCKFTGLIVKKKSKYYVSPDNLTSELMLVSKNNHCPIKANDKVIAKICKRGNKHNMHICNIITNCGSSQKASVCANAIVESSGANIEFSNKMLNEADKISKTKITKKIKQNRLDLTNKVIFTIDSEESKDLDDAVSIEKSSNCYHVGVHIADVSHYIPFKSILDVEAYKRGTSIYYANRVIPMLPPSISNGICSLNPNVNRLTFSALIDVDFNGRIINFDFKKTIIRSKIKGVYKEINEILGEHQNKNLIKKYKDVLPSILLMKELYTILKANKIKRGSPQISTTESKIILDEHDFTKNIEKRVQGISEGIIEEFMLLANEAAATLAKEANIPFVYRIHELPSDEKVLALKELSEKLGLNSKNIKPKLKPKIISDLLEQTRNTDLFPIMNMHVLRSMAKARYSPSSVGHYGLALDNYTHFTSPIRRYSDLTIHRILTDYLYKKDSAKIIKKHYSKFVSEASKHITETEKRAMLIERSTADCYKAEYMKNHIGKQFDGVITSIIKNGMFVTLPNTIEGFIRIETLKGNYQFDQFTKLIDLKTGHSYRIGQNVSITCTMANVNSGKIDFEII